MRLISNQRSLAIYSGVLTIALAATILTGFGENERKASFDRIDVQRINIVGPDGKNQLRCEANHYRSLIALKLLGTFPFGIQTVGEGNDRVRGGHLAWPGKPSFRMITAAMTPLQRKGRHPRGMVLLRRARERAAALLSAGHCAQR
jgi:hypothetical protein